MLWVVLKLKLDLEVALQRDLLPFRIYRRLGFIHLSKSRRLLCVSLVFNRVTNRLPACPAAHGTIVNGGPEPYGWRL